MTRVWFADAVESLWLKGLGDRLTPELKAELLARGLDLRPPLQPGYPAEVIGDCTRYVAPRLFPELSLDDAIYRMGEIAVDQFAYSLLGRALFPMLRVFGGRRAMQRMQSNIRTSNNFVEIDVAELAPEQFRLTFRETDGMPTFWKALTDRGSHHSGVPRKSCDRFVVDGPRLTIFYDVRKQPDSEFPGNDLDRWLSAPAIR